MRISGSWCVALCMIGMLGCDSGENKVGTADPGSQLGKADDPNGVDQRPSFLVCEGGEAPSLKEESWEHLRNRAITLGHDGHSAQDIIGIVGQAITIEGKFAYSRISKDLEDEWVEIWVDDCTGGMTLVGRELTDDDGRIHFKIPPDQFKIGRYDVYLRVVGDNTFARSSLRVLPAGTQVVVFDIDGTLTQSDGELFRDIIADFFEPLLDGDYVPVPRPSAVELTKLRRQIQGYQLIYVTGRPYNLTDITRGWLAELAFPPGTLHVVDDVAQILPTNKSVGTYKLDFLNHLQSIGLDVVVVYGNATTDVWAYGQAGIPMGQTYIAGPHGGEEGTVSVGDGYVDHLVEAAKEPSAEQPYQE